MAALLLPLCLAISPVFAADPPQPISVDDTSSLLKYDDINHWTTHVNTPARFNLYSNSDTFSDVRGAWVSFTFNGTSIEYWGNQGPYHGPCLVRLEDGTSQTVNSHYEVDNDPILLFSKYNLPPTQHTINVTVVDPSFPNVCEIDRFVYTPIATSTATPVKAKSSSVKYIAIGAGVGGALILALLVGFMLFKKRRTRRRKYPTGPGVLEDDLFTTAYNPVPVNDTSPPLTSHLAHTPSIMSSVSNAKSAEAVTPSGLFPTPYPYDNNAARRHTSMATSVTSGSNYQPSVTVASDEKSAGRPASVVDSAFSETSGEGSSAMYYPFAVPGTLSPLPPGAAAAVASSSSSMSSVPFHPPPVVPPMQTAVRPFQHEDAGRVEEVPPAYKDSWNRQGGT